MPIFNTFPGKVWLSRDDGGTSFVAVMLLMLIIGSLGVAALTMTGLENSMAGAVRMVEEGTDAAEACVGAAVRAIRLTVDDPQMTGPAAVLLEPQGPVPASNQAVFTQEINGTLRNHSDVPTGTGNAPNLVMNVNGYMVSGDIDFLYSKRRTGSDFADPEKPTYDQYYRVDCVAANAATGATSRVIATFDCLNTTGEGCVKRSANGT
jgi:Tfp pilus assembly protein PilX